MVRVGLGLEVDIRTCSESIFGIGVSLGGFTGKMCESSL